MSTNKSYAKLRVFVASPSDVSIERTRLKSVVELLNQGLADHVGVVLELKEWSQTVPDMGRAQQIIFDQLKPTQWDLFIGILWLRYGSKASGANPAESGTHEEFNIAYQLWQQHHRPRIMFYRCNRPSTTMAGFDTATFAKIEEFFKQFEMGLYRVYDTPEAFELLVREHLEKILTDYNKQEKGEPPKQTILRYADLTLDQSTREVKHGPRKVELTSTEFDLLELFMLHPRQVLTRDLIYKHIWNKDFSSESNIIEVYIRYLRKKLEASGEPRLIKTVRGAGYALRDE